MIRESSCWVSVGRRSWLEARSPEWNVATYGPQASAAGIGSNILFHLWADSEEQLTQSRKIVMGLDHQSFSGCSTLENLLLGLKERGLSARALRATEAERETIFFDLHLGHMFLTLRMQNLLVTVRGQVDDETGLIVRRSEVEEAIKSCVKPQAHSGSPQEWIDELLQNLKKSLPQAVFVAADLGRHKPLLPSPRGPRDNAQSYFGQWLGEKNEDIFDRLVGHVRLVPYRL
ncbi:MAG: hypothetical protein AB7F86_12625 [Bdellovibrionales bacterium]